MAVRYRNKDRHSCNRASAGMLKQPNNKTVWHETNANSLVYLVIYTRTNGVMNPGLDGGRKMLRTTSDQE